MYPFEYILHGRVRATPEFLQWFAGLRDRTVQRRIARRLDRLTAGNLGDWKMIDRNLFELRLHFGPGYRLYGARQGEHVFLLLAGGDKWSQFRDVALARRLRDQEDL
jgi:putative addiction module killer protein